VREAADALTTSLNVSARIVVFCVSLTYTQHLLVTRLLASLWRSLASQYAADDDRKRAMMEYVRTKCADHVRDIASFDDLQMKFNVT
jgi:hypothetical protein